MTTNIPLKANMLQQGRGHCRFFVNLNWQSGSCIICIISHMKLLTVSLVNTVSCFCVVQCWTSIKSLFARPNVNQLLSVRVRAVSKGTANSCSCEWARWLTIKTARHLIYNYGPGSGQIKNIMMMQQLKAEVVIPTEPRVNHRWLFMNKQQKQTNIKKRCSLLIHVTETGRIVTYCIQM